MQRREFIAVVGGAAAWPLAARAHQAPKMARIGMLIPSGIEAPVTREVFGVVRQGLADLGYVEGRDIVFEQRGGDGTSEGLAASASDLVSLKVDIIVAIVTPAARAAQRATETIPIVVGSVGDPVQDGFVASLSRPGGNITGTTFLGPELVSKQLALLKELLPSASRIVRCRSPHRIARPDSEPPPFLHGISPVGDRAGSCGLLSVNAQWIFPIARRMTAPNQDSRGPRRSLD